MANRDEASFDREQALEQLAAPHEIPNTGFQIAVGFEKPDEVTNTTIAGAQRIVDHIQQELRNKSCRQVTLGKDMLGTQDHTFDSWRNMSRRHLQITREDAAGARISLRDLGSTNGTYLQSRFDQDTLYRMTNLLELTRGGDLSTVILAIPINDTEGRLVLKVEPLQAALETPRESEVLKPVDKFPLSGSGSLIRGTKNRAQGTHCGDAVLSSTKFRFFAVMDGVSSGEFKGKPALGDAFAANAVNDYMRNNIANIDARLTMAAHGPTSDAVTHVEAVLVDFATQANEDLKAKNEQNLRKGLAKELGNTTLCCAHAWANNEGNFVTVVYAGDSRACLVRGNNLLQLTVDDNIVRKSFTTAEEAVKAQSVIAELDYIQDIQDTQYKHLLGEFFPGGKDLSQAVTQALGEGPLNLHHATYKLEKGDVLLLLTDGVTDTMKPSEIVREVRKNKGTMSTEDLADHLAHTALSLSETSGRYRKKPGDDISCVVVEVG